MNKPRTLREALLYTLVIYKLSLKEIRDFRNRKQIIDFLLEKELQHGLCNFMHYHYDYPRGLIKHLVDKYVSDDTSFYLGGTSVKECETKEDIIAAMQLRIDVLSEILVNKEYKNLIW